MTDQPTKRPGRWKPGQSGNPKGRSPGSGEVSKIRAALAAEVPAILQALVERAREGDTQAARLLLERTVAPLKAMEPAQAIHLPEGSLTEQGRAILAAVASAELAPTQGAHLLSAIGSLARVAEIDDLAQRIEALEKQQEGKQ